MGNVSNKNKRIYTFAILAAVAILAIAMGVLLGGKISGVLFSGQDLFTKEEQTVQATPVPTKATSAPIVVPTAAAVPTEEPTPVPTEEPVITPAPTLDPY